MSNPKPVSVYGVTFQKLFDKIDVKDTGSCPIYTDINGYMANVSLDTTTVDSDDFVFAKGINYFVACVRKGVPCKAPAQDGIDIMIIL